MRARPALVAAATVATLVPAAPAVAAGRVCAGVPRCHVVARTDVNGDGRVDTVALATRGASGSPDRSVVVRVDTGAARVLTLRRPTPYWSGGVWQGAARLDGRPGRELVIGATMGAHTEFFRVLTWRRGHLVDLAAPDGRRRWVVDGAANVLLGWQRTDRDPVGLLRRYAAERDATGGPMHGTVTTYRWRSGGWVATHRRVVARIRPAEADRWVGWHVPGLQRY